MRAQLTPGFEAAHDAQEPSNYKQTVAANRTGGFGEEVRKRILLGTYALSAEAWDSYYVNAARIRRALRQEFHDVFTTSDVCRTDRVEMHADGAKVDVLLSPMGLGAPPHLTCDSAGEYAQDVLTAPANLVGTPSLSVPAATLLHESDGANVPVGISLTAQWGHEDLLFYVAQHMRAAGLTLL